MTLRPDQYPKLDIHLKDHLDELFMVTKAVEKRTKWDFMPRIYVKIDPNFGRT